MGNCEANRMSDSLMFIENATVPGHLGSARGLSSPWTGQTVNWSFGNSAKFLLHSRSKFATPPPKSYSDTSANEDNYFRGHIRQPKSSLAETCPFHLLEWPGHSCLLLYVSARIQ